MILISIAVSSAAMVLNPPPKPPDATAGQLDIPTADEGRAIPVVYGTITIKSCNIIDWFGASTTPIRTEGGKK